ncbi:WD40 repeat-like protein, partial [Ramaria rubella]
LKGHTKPINVLQFSPDGQLLASGGDDSHICVWSTHQGTLVQKVSCAASGPVTDIIWVTNARTELSLIFSCADGSIHVY